MESTQLFDKLCSSRFKVEPKVEVQIVPWMNWNEWKELYGYLYSDDPKEMQRGVDLAAIMRARRKLPVGLDHSAKFVKAYLQAKETPGNAEELLSYALVRFISCVTGLQQDQYYHKNMDDIAHSINLDDWLIEVRHNCIHGQQPSRAELERAIDIALEWLRVEYWERQEEGIVDYLEQPGGIAEQHAEAKEKFRSQLYEALTDWLVLNKRATKAAVMELLDTNINAFFSTLVSKESPIFHEDVVGSSKSSEFPTSALKRCGRQLVKSLVAAGQIQRFVNRLLNYMTEEHAMASQWLSLVLWEGSCRDIVNWRDMIRPLLENPGVNTTILLKQLFPHLTPKLKRSDEKFILQLVDALYPPPAKKENLSRSLLKQNLVKLEDILSSTSRSSSPPSKKTRLNPDTRIVKKVSTWTLVDEEWDTPIGLIPGQTVEGLRQELKDLAGW